MFYKLAISCKFDKTIPVFSKRKAFQTVSFLGMIDNFSPSNFSDINSLM